MSVPEAEATLVRFLLGALHEQEHAAVEERLFTEAGLQGRLDIATDDLIHRYLAGGLDADDHARFERYFLASRRHRERLVFVRDLLAAADRVRSARVPRVADTPGARPRATPWALAAGVLLAVGAALATRIPPPGAERAAAPPTPPPPSLAAVPLSPPETLTLPPSPGPRLDPEHGEQAPAPPPGPPAPAPGTVRIIRVSEGVYTNPVDVSMTPSTRAVRVEAALEPRGLAYAGAPREETRHEGGQAPVSLPPSRLLTSGPPTFKAVVRDSTGRDVWRAEGLAPSTSGRSMVTVEVPAEVFTSRNYTLSIQEVARGEAARNAPAMVDLHLRVLQRP
jgi:hypothetical protein